MEQMLDRLVKGKGIEIDKATGAKLCEYTRLIHAESGKFNLTGLKNVKDILNTLVIESIVPLMELDVPHGTRFVDIGSGAGIPGIPLGICHPDMKGVLVEAQYKKALFMRRVIAELDIGNLQVVHGRVEELCRMPDYRETFEWGFSRAFGGIYEVIELGLPLVWAGGHFFIYSRLCTADLDSAMHDHADKLGACFDDRGSESFPGKRDGLLLHKKRVTDPRYPRNYAAIHRDAARISGLNEK